MNFASIFFAAFYFLIINCNAQIGRKLETFSEGDFDKQVYKVQQYGREFMKFTKVQKDGNSKNEYLFLNYELVQVKMFAADNKGSFEKLGDEFRELVWKMNFDDEKINDVEKTDSLTAYFGENGGLLVIGKGENKGTMLVQSAKMRFVTDKWIRSQVVSQAKKEDSDGLKLTGIQVGGRMKPVFSTDGGLKGYMSDKGLFFNQNMEYQGWIGK